MNFRNLIKNFKTWLNAVQELEKLRSENTMLRERVHKNQEVINKTNAYWKGVVRKLETQNSSKQKSHRQKTSQV